MKAKKLADREFPVPSIEMGAKGGEKRCAAVMVNIIYRTMVVGADAILKAIGPIDISCQKRNVSNDSKVILQT